MVNLTSELYRLFSPEPRPVVNFIKWLAQQYGLTERLSLLDIGIGTGQAMPYYKAAGWSVIGYEPEEMFVAAARESAEKSPHVTIKQGGFLQITEQEVVTVAVAINAPFAYLLTEDERAEALRRVYHALCPHGVVMLELPNLLWFLRHKPTSEIEEKPFKSGRARYQCRYVFDFHAATMTMQNEYTVLDGKNALHKVCTQDTLAILKQSEIASQMTNVGFGDIRIFSDYTMRTQGRADGAQLIITAQKER